MAFCFLKTEEEASSNHCLEPRSKRRDRAELQANVRHFELSRRRIAARMRTCQCMCHFVYNLRSRPLVRDLAARVRGQIASDHCRSDLITGHTHTGPGRGTPFLKLIYLRGRTGGLSCHTCSHSIGEQEGAADLECKRQMCSAL